MHPNTTTTTLCSVEGMSLSSKSTFGSLDTETGEEETKREEENVHVGGKPSRHIETLFTLFRLMGFCDFLGTRQLCVCARVNRRGAELIRSSGWKHITLAGRATAAADDSLLRQLLARNPKVERLQIPYCSKITPAVLSIVRRLPLKRLVFTGCVGLISDSSLLQIFDSPDCPLSSLEHLDLSGCVRLSQNAVLRALVVLPNLQSLSVSGLTSIRDAGVESIAKLCPKLTRLHMSSCGSVTSAGIVGLASRLGAQLEELVVSYCNKISDEALGALGSHCHCLVKLSLYSCTLVTDKGLASLRSLPRLSELDLSMCRQVSDAGIISLVAGPGRVGNTTTASAAPKELAQMLLPASPVSSREPTIQKQATDVRPDDRDVSRQAVVAIEEAHQGAPKAVPAIYLGKADAESAAQLEAESGAGTVASVFRGMPSSPITRLNLYNCSRLSDATVDALSSSCNMEQLGLYGLSALSSDALCRALSRWPRIESIEMGGLQSGDDVMTELRGRCPSFDRIF